ncbi:uncharacterized protein LOC125480727 isoform X2 [Pyrus x bretschneideri]|uniref:uncharacterized protein LOC125480727 isoform X2 n=1 Tax=Pyrus x bretschneideri TaxID=225117 RepID=UPI00202FD598|nr:uncharacterized protein LOC125480727 isoform X2 [Pyrus x bretschneideri]
MRQKTTKEGGDCQECKTQVGEDKQWRRNQGCRSLIKDPAKAYTSNPSFTQQPPKRPLLSSTTCKFLRNKEPHPQESVIHSSSIHMSWFFGMQLKV